MKTVKITLKQKGEPDKLVEVPAYIVGSFAVHRGVRGLTPAGEPKMIPEWTVTHIKTGMMAAFGICRVKAARAVARALQAVPSVNWDADDVPEQIKKPGVGPACLEAISEHRFA